MFCSNCSPPTHYIHKLKIPYPSSHRIIPPIRLIPIYPTMESADARVALLSFYLSRNAGPKSVPPSPIRRADRSKGRSSPGKVPQRSTLKRPTIDLFGAGGQTIYGVSEGCPTLAALGRLEAVEEQRRMQLLEAQRALMDRLHAGAKEREGEVKEGEEMFAKYIDIDKCI